MRVTCRFKELLVPRTKNGESRRCTLRPGPSDPTATSCRSSRSWPGAARSPLYWWTWGTGREHHGGSLCFFRAHTCFSGHVHDNLPSLRACDSHVSSLAPTNLDSALFKMHQLVGYSLWYRVFIPERFWLEESRRTLTTGVSNMTFLVLNAIRRFAFRRPGSGRVSRLAHTPTRPNVKCKRVLRRTPSHQDDTLLMSRSLWQDEFADSVRTTQKSDIQKKSQKNYGRRKLQAHWPRMRRT